MATPINTRGERPVGIDGRVLLSEGDAVRYKGSSLALKGATGVIKGFTLHGHARVRFDLHWVGHAAPSEVLCYPRDLEHVDQDPVG